MEQLKAEKAENDFHSLKRREDANDRKLADLKQAAIRKLRRDK